MSRQKTDSVSSAAVHDDNGRVFILILQVAREGAYDDTAGRHIDQPSVPSEDLRRQGDDARKRLGGCIPLDYRVVEIDIGPAQACLQLPGDLGAFIRETDDGAFHVPSPLRKPWVKAAS